jgi:hypothetical protein
MMEAVRTSETSVDNHFTRQYIPEDNSELRFSLNPWLLMDCLQHEQPNIFMTNVDSALSTAGLTVTQTRYSAPGVDK